MECEDIIRLCRNCGHNAETICITQDGGWTTATMVCPSCGRRFNTNINRLEQWSIRNRKRINARKAEIDFLIRRKRWARKILAENGLTKPSDTIEGVFEKTRFKIRIGPRGGVRIAEIGTMTA